MNQEVPEDAFAEKFDMGLWKRVFRIALRYKRLQGFPIKSGLIK